MKWTMRFVVYLALVTASMQLFCQIAPVAAGVNNQQSPTLEETISFMNNSVESEDGYVSSVNNCELYFTRNKSFTFALPASKSIDSTDKFGKPHYAINWMIVNAPPRIYRFNLAKVDPSSINSKPVPSVEFVKSHKGDSSALSNPDLDLVMFEASNAEKVIEVGNLKTATNGLASPIFDKKVSTEMLVFESKDRAERFVTAFVHAVKLCGGTGSLFAPTPSKP